ncbi:glycine dehydrogenase subunit 2 [Puccinia graminis f. sp. tritici CRL 75-36-700-3]|uniref:glycine dehydrogenase (aminomethyl-transferring) n=1 Tax=Puccinia graminis f. sp. tritici (strain CRL 75-36-700-3 / race SCCL) TaxID=418459 RepID=E3JVS1_PUCGT|nr:glycine dehydrogenase subunit 2 [Puccinia graminis f. sp. tritici CRL 75-36-700-3]EFP76146.2 glycine dehydrogenase subunit 2 [Puccinia graminis f. sp. tritici CRL 75-36-700-3]
MLSRRILSKHRPFSTHSVFTPLDSFPSRHLGPRDHDTKLMLNSLGFSSLDQFIDKVIPQSIRVSPLSNQDIKPHSESELTQRALQLAHKNTIAKNFIGMGYSNALMPPPIATNVLQNPAWYTSYTPYQAEISQGRLESLINFQTMISSLTGLPIANASLLDEATAAAEAMTLSYNQSKSQSRKTFIVDRSVFPQSIAVLRNRAAPAGIKLIVTNIKKYMDGQEALPSDCFGVLVQYPERRGDLTDWSRLADAVHKNGALLSCATDLLALTKIKPPGEWGADIALGNSARFGVPLGYGGPHAAFFAVKDSLTRKIPGRLIGLSKDSNGKPAYRLALQTREQHIRRDKALSNVCTAQALLANLAAFYAVYHGPHGLRRIADRVHGMTQVLAAGLEKLSYEVVNQTYFDRLTVNTSGLAISVVLSEAKSRHINLRHADDFHVGITLDETHSLNDILALLNLFVDLNELKFNRRLGPDHHYSEQSLLALADSLNLKPVIGPLSDQSLVSSTDPSSSSSSSSEPLPASNKIPTSLSRQTNFLEHPVFNRYHSETELMRYIASLQKKDLSLVDAMIPLGSCTMKLNSATSMGPLSWKAFSSIHPFAPQEQAAGYMEMIKELEADLSKITGFPAISLQPNSGAQGEYAGLSVIRAYHHSRGDQKRDVCLVPVSAHGTNPASAVMAGMKVIPVKTMKDGSLDLEDLSAKAAKHQEQLAAIMITYPSTYGVFESQVQEACEIIHRHGGQVYLDGANMNAQIGLTNPVKCGADVCHLNLHKTFGIPHGGGGPGVGPIGVAEHLAEFLPSHPMIDGRIDKYNCGSKSDKAIHPVSSAPWGSASILSISWSYIKLLGGQGLTLSSKIALLNANYLANSLKNHFDLKFKNESGLCAHEFLIDFSEFEKKYGIKVMDIAKRLIDYGFHPPTCSWPLSTSMLIEPTESESKAELDRFLDALISIRKELATEQGRFLIKNAPFDLDSAFRLAADPKGRLQLPSSENDEHSASPAQILQNAVYPVDNLKKNKFWPSVARVDDTYGDMNIFCTCPSVEEVAGSDSDTEP